MVNGDGTRGRRPIGRCNRQGLFASIGRRQKTAIDGVDMNVGGRKRGLHRVDHEPHAFSLGPEDLGEFRRHGHGVRDGVGRAHIVQHLQQQGHEGTRIALDLVWAPAHGQNRTAIDVGYLGVDTADIPANRGHLFNLPQGHAG